MWDIFQLHKLQMVVARRYKNSFHTDTCFQYGSYADYVNYFENPLSQFEKSLTKLKENSDWQTCFLKFKDLYEQKPTGEKLYIDDPVCEKYHGLYNRYFNPPTKADFGLERGRTIP